MQDLALLQSGQLTMRNDHFRVQMVLAEVVQLVKWVSLGRSVSITCDYNRLLEQRIIGDKSRLQQVFMNLLTNAIKHSPEGGKITVTASTQ